MSRIYNIGKVIPAIILTTMLLSTISVLPLVSAEGQSVLAKEIAEVHQATKQYHDVNEALTAGYVPVSPHIPGMGAHYVNFGLVDEVFDPTQPEILLYSLTEGNKPKLVAVEYAALGEAPPEGFTGSSDEWEIHEAACHYADGYEEPQPAPFLCSPTSPGGAPLALWHPDMWALHVWVWRANPDGIFTPMNPNVP